MTTPPLEPPVGPPEKAPAPRFLLTLEPVTAPYPATAGLRRLLKTLLRHYGLRCVDVREIPAR